MNAIRADETAHYEPKGPHWGRAVQVIGTFDRSREQYPFIRLISLPAGPILEFRGREAVLGRHTTADFQIPQPDVSRRHCRLAFYDDAWHVIDLNSLNGTSLNGHEIKASRLKTDDMLRVGGNTFQIEVAGRPSAKSPHEVAKRERTRTVLNSIASRFSPAGVN